MDLTELVEMSWVGWGGGRRVASSETEHEAIYIRAMNEKINVHVSEFSAFMYPRG